MIAAEQLCSALSRPRRPAPALARFRALLSGFAAFWLLSSGHVAAFSPAMPFPIRTSIDLAPAFESYDMPIGPWRDGNLPVERRDGQVNRRAWQLDAPGASLLEVLAPLRAELLAEGYEIALDCEARDCGGFDFRFGITVLPEPEMHVDLNNFRFLSARKGDQALSLLVSRSGDLAFVQMVHVGPEPLPPLRPGAGAAPLPIAESPADQPVERPAAAEELPRAPEDGAALLQAGLPFALDDLVFESGSARLAAGDFPSLRKLADWLGENAGQRLILVGHTDLSGALEPNIALSKRRAEAVRERLIRDFGLAPARVQAEGAGPLSPRASNVTEEGRQKNRRVEAIPAPL